MATQGATWKSPESYSHLVVLVIVLAAIAWVGLAGPENRVVAWLTILALLIAFTVIAGHGITGLWRGILIDDRFKMSLSRFQMFAWTLLVLSTILTVAFANLAAGWMSPLEFEVPSQLWVLMGISTASLVGSPLVLTSRKDKVPANKARDDGFKALVAQGYEEVDTDETSVVVRNKDPRKARWADLIKGEEVGNAATVDLGKLQMFLFTFILILAYGASVAALLEAPDGPILALPEIQDGMNVLLGISHTGYLSYKAVPHTPEQPGANP